MTLEEKQQLQEVYDWMKQRKVQQLAYPVDDASRDALRAVLGVGVGSTTKTQTIILTGNAQSISVPAAYVRTFLINIDGAYYEVPSLT